jgi:pimeloyl-ACP methyl ester carboxylesterase
MPIAKANGININYKVEGHGDPLVMIMGFSSGRSQWSSQIPFFKKYYKVVTFDNRGVGKSDKPEGSYSTKMMADDTVKLMDHLEIKKARIIGASMGGMIAQELAINYPKRVSKLVLACTYALKDDINGDTAEQAELVHLSPQKMAAGMVKLAVNNRFNQFVFGTLAMILSNFMSVSSKTGLKGQTEACNTHDTLDRLSSIKAPTLVIVGTKDRLIKPISSEVISRNIPGAKLKEVEGGSHMFYMEMRTSFNQIVLDFLKS